MISSRWRLPFFTPSPFSHQKTTLPGLKENERRPKASPSLLHSRAAVPVLLMSSCILIGNHTIFDMAALIQEIVLATPPSPHQCTPKCSSQVSAFEATLLGEKTLPKECWAQLSYLWWMPKSVSKVFDAALKTGSSRGFKRYPTTYSECQVDFPLLWIKDYPGLY